MQIGIPSGKASSSASDATASTQPELTGARRGLAGSMESRNLAGPGDGSHCGAGLAPRSQPPPRDSSAAVRRASPPNSRDAVTGIFGLARSNNRSAMLARGRVAILGQCRVGPVNSIMDGTAEARSHHDRLAAGHPATAVHAGRAFVAPGPWRQPWHIGCNTRSKGSFAFGGRSVCVLSACTKRTASGILMCTGTRRAAHAALSALSYTRIRHTVRRAVTHCPPSISWRAECHRADSFNHSP